MTIELGERGGPNHCGGKEGVTKPKARWPTDDPQRGRKTVKIAKVETRPHKTFTNENRGKEPGGGPVLDRLRNGLLGVRESRPGQTLVNALNGGGRVGNTTAKKKNGRKPKKTHGEDKCGAGAA